MFFYLVFILGVMSVTSSLKDDTIMRQNFFDIDLIRHATQDKKGNVLISPASIKSTLAMLMEGARGLTSDEIRKAMRLSNDENEAREQINSYLKSLRISNEEVILENANKIFVSNNLKVSKQFEETLNKIYYADIERVDFRQTELTADSINKWVSNKTNGVIEQLVEAAEIEPTAVATLANALYFKTGWLHAFDPNQTHSDCFYVNGDCKKVYMMEIQKELKYAQVDVLAAHAVELPYQCGRHTMLILIPFEKDACSALIRDLPYMSVPRILQLMKKTDVELSMPRLKLKYTDDVMDTMKSLNIKSIFTNTANLSGIFEDKVNPSPYINNIFHKTYLEVNEHGTEAAAATGAQIVPLMGSLGVRVNVDHPFLLFIRDTLTDALLFEGMIVEPEAYIEKS